MRQLQANLRSQYKKLAYGYILCDFGNDGIFTGLSMGMEFPWESHEKCPMGWDGMGLHALHFPWDLWDSSHVIAF